VRLLCLPNGKGQSSRSSGLEVKERLVADKKTRMGQLESSKWPAYAGNVLCTLLLGRLSSLDQANGQNPSLHAPVLVLRARKTFSEFID
jgi:hypothetical protein